MKSSPFSLVSISPDTVTDFMEGRVIWSSNRCGMFLCRRGNASVNVGGSHLTVSSGEMLIYMPSTTVVLTGHSADVAGDLIDATIDYLLPMVNKVIGVEDMLLIRRQPVVSLASGEFESLSRRFDGVHHWLSAGDKELAARCAGIRQEVVMSEVQTLCYEMLMYYYGNVEHVPASNSKGDMVFQQFLISLYRHYLSEREVSFYAAEQNMSPRYFSTVVRNASGRPALAWIVQMVIAEAKRLLERSDMSVKEIAARLNFPTQTFFGKYFKNAVGVSPKDYRKAHSVRP